MTTEEGGRQLDDSEASVRAARGGPRFSRIGEVAPRAGRRARPDARPRSEKRPVREKEEGEKEHKL